MMKETYETLELEIVKFDSEVLMEMSGLDNDGELPPEWGGVPDYRCRMKKKWIVIIVVILLICGVVILVVNFLGGKDTPSTKKNTSNSTIQIETQEESIEELNESNSYETEAIEEENSEESVKDVLQNFDNEVEVPKEWGE